MVFFAEDVHLLARYLCFCFFELVFLVFLLHRDSFSVRVQMEGFVCGKSQKTQRKIVSFRLLET